MTLEFDTVKNILFSLIDPNPKDKRDKLLNDAILDCFNEYKKIFETNFELEKLK